MVDERRQVQLPRQLHGSVGTVVVNHQNFVHNIPRQFRARLPQCADSVVRRHDDKDLLSVQQGASSSP